MIDVFTDNFNVIIETAARRKPLAKLLRPYVKNKINNKMPVCLFSLIKQYFLLGVSISRGRNGLDFECLDPLSLKSYRAIVPRD